MFHCPHCAAPIRWTHALTAAPIGTRACESCAGRYFAGGLPLAMAAICVAVPLGAAAAAIYRSAWWFFGLLFAALIAAAFSSINSPLQPARRRWRVLAKMFSAPLLLWFALEAFRLIR